MAELILLPTYKDSRGKLTVIEKCLPFDIKRVYYIYEVDDSVRGMHKHKKTVQAAVALVGECTIVIKTLDSEKRYLLNRPDQCLLLMPDDFHYMEGFSKDAVLMVLASEVFDPNDYITKIE